jgi:hypothetical protein
MDVACGGYHARVVTKNRRENRVVAVHAIIAMVAMGKDQAGDKAFISEKSRFSSTEREGGEGVVEQGSIEMKWGR